MRSDRALVVDDNDDHREVVMRLLGWEGWDVMGAEDGTSAMAKFWGAVNAGRPFRLVVTDIAMPLMDGLTTAERMRWVEGERGMSRAFIVGLTAYDDYQYSDEARRRADFDRWLRKPVSPEELRAACQEARGGRA